MERKFGYLIILSFLSLVLGGCGTGSSSSSGGGAYLSWVGSVNGAIVLDASGNQYEFSAASGCLISVNTQSAPQGFCLTPGGSSGGFAPTGPTGCSNPSSNADCNSASFAVQLTDNSSKTGCIAVLSNGTASSGLANQALAVTDTSIGFLVQVATPTAFTAYWNGDIPVCGGSNPYAGMYSSTYACPGGGTPFGVTFTGTYIIDSGGEITNAPPQLFGTIDSTGAGSITHKDANQLEVMTISGATQDSNGKWVITAVVSQITAYTAAGGGSNICSHSGSSTTDLTFTLTQA